MPPPPGELLEKLLKLGFIAADDMKEIRNLAAARGIPLAEAALLGNRLRADARGWILAETLGIPFLEIDPGSVPVALAELLPEAMARENLMVPISREGDRLTVAVPDPFRYKAFAAVEESTALSLRIVVTAVRTIGQILERLYPAPEGVPSIGLAGGGITREEAEEWISLGGGRRVAVEVLLHAAGRGLSGLRMYPTGQDILIEGRGGETAVLLLSCPLRCREILVDAFRGLAGISGKGNEATDAVFHLESASGVTAFRASFVRGLSGPEVIVKVLSDQRSGIALESVGMNLSQFEIARKVLGMQSGLFLLSSPGPEGVATTLFAMLREAHRPNRRVVTVEEQHRFRNEGYIQLERRQAEGQYAGKWSRLAESLEPDILLVEHVSDPADLLELLHLAQSGAIVLCGIRRFNFDRTLRTILTLDVDPFILANVMRLAMHQRLVKLLCLECRRPVPARPSFRMVSDRYRPELERVTEEASFFLPSGCPKCQGTGYSGRMALIELLPFTPGVQNTVVSEASLEEKLALLREEDFYPALQSVHDLLRRGMVTYDEVQPFFR
ncbi:MAG TPA: ATPase, T2SS/T4P/T4SS family [Candidatus Deferrimicrobiaceae bacterium]